MCRLTWYFQVTCLGCTDGDGITLPSTAEYKFSFKRGGNHQTITEFLRKAQFPKVLGSVLDATLIKRQTPSENEPSYVCRKGFHALNVQTVAEATLRYEWNWYEFKSLLHRYGTQGLSPFGLELCDTRNVERGLTLTQLKKLPTRFKCLKNQKLC